MQVERAGPDDLGAIERLLVTSGLPLDGARDAFATGVVARQRGEIVGAAAVEPHGPTGLLRSVVVEPALRGTGIGGTLVDSSEMLARDLGIDELYLLTETAETWFERRGYRAIERDVVPEPVRGSIEFTTACSTTAVAMWRALGRNRRAPSRISVVERRDPGEGDDRDQPEAERGGDDDRERRGEA